MLFHTGNITFVSFLYANITAYLSTITEEQIYCRHVVVLGQCGKATFHSQKTHQRNRLTVALSALTDWSLVKPMDMIIAKASSLGTKLATAVADWRLGGTNGAAKSANILCHSGFAMYMYISKKS